MVNHDHPQGKLVRKKDSTFPTNSSKRDSLSQEPRSPEAHLCWKLTLKPQALEDSWGSLQAPSNYYLGNTCELDSGTHRASLPPLHFLTGRIHSIFYQASQGAEITAHVKLVDRKLQEGRNCLLSWFPPSGNRINAVNLSSKDNSACLGFQRLLRYTHRVGLELQMEEGQVATADSHLGSTPRLRETDHETVPQSERTVAHLLSLFFLSPKGDPPRPKSPLKFSTLFCLGVV